MDIYEDVNINPFGVNVLSLFDGMCCGMIAMKSAGLDVANYDAYEIDKYAIKTAKHNFPLIREHGDVFNADFTKYNNIDFLIGGSVCTYWSIAQTKNRETVASGIGWDLFCQYVRALNEVKPRYFIYENNHSMSDAIRDSINQTFGFEAVMINSNLVSAQSRRRLYWVGKLNIDGTYSKIEVKQPDDAGIILSDVIENAFAMRDKSHAIIGSIGRTTYREYFIKNQGELAAIPVGDGAIDFNNQAIYNVYDGQITVKGIQYPVPLANGKYFLRKITINECKRLQTVPEWYEFPVSKTQAYKMLGNGWTCEVIAHLIKSCINSD